MSLSLPQFKLQRLLDIYVYVSDPQYLRANDPDVVALMNYDLPTAEDSLRIFLERHQDDCDVVGHNPLTLKVRPTLRDCMIKANEKQKSVFMRIKRRDRAWKP
ncbi:MAG: hypothetical protein ACYCT2_04820 [Thermoplasmataceae archaeon]